MLAFDEVRRASRADGRVYVGGSTVEVSRIVGRWRQFGGSFMPVESSTEARWKRIDLAFRRGEELPPVALYEVGGDYFVFDGNHRVSVARFHRVEMMDAEVTEFFSRSPAVSEGEKDQRRGEESPVRARKGRWLARGAWA